MRGLVRDARSKKISDFGRRGRSADKVEASREPGRSLADRVGRMLRGLLTSKIAPKLDAKRKKTSR